MLSVAFMPLIVAIMIIGLVFALVYGIILLVLNCIDMAKVRAEARQIVESQEYYDVANFA